MKAFDRGVDRGIEISVPAQNKAASVQNQRVRPSFGETAHSARISSTPYSRPIMQKITPFLWFNDQAEAAARFYVSVFKSSKVIKILRYSKGSQGKAGSVMTVKFRIMGQEFVALNGGALFKFTPATSFVVNCRTQREVDYYWRKLSAGGRKVQCGWLEDKYGLSWQIVPTVLIDLFNSKDAKQVERVNAAMLKMVKFDIKRLQKAAAGK
jgi:predicted 3-demethylubiquinone-9 3-methyltransferase (glyoxalase superfamily)